ncbi:Ubiquitin fusion degradation protein 4 [Knufia fluminis]|uniref:HECT-type E3 ubiquitin transferase n=1 Tax=Knufia fluminis TaxID=191047 RepID=A0AAN8EJ49_9EURO|nr:Ubiquitin fusion degradation protein 4 [Knufia fluminis]
MSSRVTRSSARLAAESERNDDNDINEPSSNSATKTPAKSKKRKAAARPDSSPPPAEPDQSPPQTSVRRSKRQKTTTAPFTPSTTATSPRSTRSSKKSAKQEVDMSSNGYGQDKTTGDERLTKTRSNTKQTDDSQKQSNSKSSSRGPSSRSKKSSAPGIPLRPAESASTDSSQDLSPPSQPTSSRKLKKSRPKKDNDVEMKDPEQDSKTSKKHSSSTPPPMQQDSNSDMSPDPPPDDSHDPFSSALFGAGGPSGLSSTLRALSGMMTGMASRFRDILNNLRRVDDPTMQMVALEELSNLLLVSNEDNLAGQFSPDPYVKELVALMQPNPITGEENPEIMLLACRSLANLMEALRGSVANVVYGGAVPVLCQKLLDIQYIDVAEQALSTLSTISRDFPASIVREGGLTACLQYLDFFATGTQRTAVTTAANCCRNIPQDSFPVIRDVMPNLRNVLVGHDQKVVEQGSLCVTRLIDSFKYSPDKLEQLVDTELLKAILGLLLPGTTNLIGSNIHTEFLRVLAIVARNSPKLSAELLKLNVVDTLYQILTGVSPPSETTDAASSIDSVVIMQALIHRPREQIYETLNVICELLPRISMGGAFDDLSSDSEDETKVSKQEERKTLLKDCEQQTRRFAMVLLPTLTDAYSSTVNLSVRQKVLTAQLKMLSNLDGKVIEDALRPVPYASFLASILSQEDHPSLVMFALQASELLFERLEGIYRYQFYREGVIGEIKKLAARAPEIEARSNLRKDSHASAAGATNAKPKNDVDAPQNVDSSSEDEDENQEDRDDEDDEDDDDDREDDIVIRDEADMDDDHDSDSEQEDIPAPLAIPGVKDLVVLRAKAFIEKYDAESGREMREKAEKIRSDLRDLADAIRGHYQNSEDKKKGQELFDRLAKYFIGDALESITSSELLDSGLISLLGEILKPNGELAGNARSDFIAAFMGTTNPAKIKTSTSSSTSTAFTALVLKLQDLLSRAEHFEVLTVNSSPSENSRSSSTSLLSRQIRLQLKAGEDSNIPPSFRDMVVSIHAIATFKALDDYLRPRITLSERAPTDRSRSRRDMLQQLANARMAQLSGAAESGLFSPFGTELGSLPPGSSPQSISRPSSRSKPPTSSSRPKEESTSKTEKTSRRRSSRRNHVPDASDPVPPPLPDAENDASQLEVVDEKHVEDDDVNNGPGSADPLDPVVGEVEEEGSDDGREPDAVNMEITSAGRVTARKEDGSRVYTPQQPGTPVAPSRTASSDQSPAVPRSSSSSSKRHTSYAAAAATPQDWHIEFSIDGKPLADNITIYRAIHHNRDMATNDPTGRTIWAGIHEVKFRKVSGPAPDAKLSTSEDDSRSRQQEGLPVSLDGHPITSSILTLLGILHELNASIDDIRESLGRAAIKLYPEPLASFINTKLTAKMNRQLEEPLIVASNCLPDWSEDLARSFPFLFPFETRHLFLQSTSFGYARSITRWQNSQESDDRRDRRRDDRPLMGRPQRQKVRIARTKMLESAMKVMDHFGPSPSILEVEYFEEVGTGLGPTLEFYSTVSKEFAKKNLKLWRENDTDAKDQYAFGKNGLFPAPMSEDDKKTEKGKKVLECFKILGKFVARSMLDSRIIDVNFSPTFFKIGDEPKPSMALLRTIDQDLANSMAQLQAYNNKRNNIEADTSMSPAAKSTALQNLTIRGATLEDLGLDFTLPGYPSIALIENGHEVDVTDENLCLYIEEVLDFTLGQGVQSQIQAFRNGFSQVFPYNSLKAFTPNELVMLFGRVDEDWSIETLMDSLKADHGFNMDSKSVKNLLAYMSELTAAQRRDFLQFITGSPRLPIGGFKSLTPMFTVVCKPSEPPYSSDDYLPSVMTCANYLKLPDYSDVNVLREKLGVAIREGQGAFHLS